MLNWIFYLSMAEQYMMALSLELTSAITKQQDVHPTIFTGDTPSLKILVPFVFWGHAMDSVYIFGYRNS